MLSSTQMDSGTRGATVVEGSRRRAALELAGVLTTGVTFVAVVPHLPNKLFFIVPCILAWLGYLVWRVVEDRAVLHAWGLRVDNLGPASRVPLALGILGVVGIVACRAVMGWRPLPVSSIAIFVTYPIWGLFQQLFVQALLADNLARLGMPRRAIIPTASLLFGAVHLPDLALSGLCALAGLAWTSCWLSGRNLLPLALVHGWLGTLVYYWVLERNPLTP